MHVPLVFMSPKWMVLILIDAHDLDNFSGEWCRKYFKVDIQTLKWSILSSYWYLYLKNVHSIGISTIVSVSY